MVLSCCRVRGRPEFLESFTQLPSHTMSVCTRLAGTERLTIACFIEAVLWVTVGREDGNFVASILKTNGGVNYQALSTANPQIGVEEDDIHTLNK